MRVYGRLLTAFAIVGGLVAGPATIAAADSGPDAGVAAVRALGRQVASDLAGSTGQVSARVDIAGFGSFAVGTAEPLRPASTQKIFTATTGLLALGKDFRYVTPVLTNAPGIRSDGLVAGDLVIRGSGDPTLTSARLDGLAKALHRAGVRRVTGGVYVDDSRYGHDTVAPGWQPDFLGSEAGPISAFTVDRNMWRDDAGYLANPTPANGRLFWNALGRAGIQVVNGLHFGTPQRAATVQLATDGSAPLADIVTSMLKRSDNFYAEMLLREVGAKLTGHGTRATGISAVNAAARRLHVRLGDVYDGSGLSYLDRETPDRFVAWLQAASRTPAGDVLARALPTSCTPPGTLRHRLCGAWLTGRVHAKTGTLDGVATLAGYTTTRSGERVTFSVLTSGATDLWTARSSIDAAVARLARFDPGAPPAPDPAPAAPKAAPAQQPAVTVPAPRRPAAAPKQRSTPPKAPQLRAAAASRAVTDTGGNPVLPISAGILLVGSALAGLRYRRPV